MEYNIITKRGKMIKTDIIKYQVITHCFINNISLSDAELKCLTELILQGSAELNTFCLFISDRKIFNSPQTVRNCLNKIQKHNLIFKEGKNKKNIYVNPMLNIKYEGNIILDFKFLLHESN